MTLDLFGILLSIWEDFCKATGAYWHPDMAESCPWASVTAKDTDTRKSRVTVEEKKPIVKNYAGFQYKETELVTEGGCVVIEDVRVKKENAANTDLTSADKEEINKRGLFLDKATVLKPIYATGLSIKQAATMKKDERGYSERTIAKYFAAFSSAIGA